MRRRAWFGVAVLLGLLLLPGRALADGLGGAVGTVSSTTQAAASTVTTTVSTATTAATTATTSPSSAAPAATSTVSSAASAVTQAAGTATAAVRPTATAAVNTVTTTAAAATTAATPAVQQTASAAVSTVQSAVQTTIGTVAQAAVPVVPTATQTAPPPAVQTVTQAAIPVATTASTMSDTTSGRNPVSQTPEASPAPPAPPTSQVVAPPTTPAVQVAAPPRPTVKASGITRNVGHVVVHPAPRQVVHRRAAPTPTKQLANLVPTSSRSQVHVAVSQAHGWIPGFGLVGAVLGAGAAGAFGSSAVSVFVALTLFLVAGRWGSRVVRRPAARPPRPSFALLLEHPG